MLILTVPEGVTAALMMSRRATRINVTTVMTIMENKIVLPILLSSSYWPIPMKVMKAMPMRPTVMKVIPRPLSAGGTLE